MNTQGYDLIGDIHGQYDKLEALLRHLGYHRSGGTWKHGEQRKVIFLGDYVDRGPKVREVLQTVRGMVEAGDALAIMGNHEYNAVCLHTPDERGGWLRPRTETNLRQVHATRQQFAAHEDEWAGWLAWMKQLPMYLDLGALRCVHACWDGRSLERLAGQTLEDEDFLKLTATRTTVEYQAVEIILKGPEVRLMPGQKFRDKEGTERGTIRTRWWDIREGLTLGEVAMPPGCLEDVRKVDARALCEIPHYGPAEPPVFCGHYWMAPEAERAPLTQNIACLDYSAGLDGPLVAYRWDGEAKLTPEHFAFVALTAR